MWAGPPELDAEEDGGVGREGDVGTNGGPSQDTLSRASSASNLAAGDSEAEMNDTGGSASSSKNRSRGDARSWLDDSAKDAKCGATSQSVGRDTTPKDATGEPARCRKSTPIASLNDRDDVGNIGWMFGNWGSRASSKGVQDNIDLQIKHSPAQVIGLTECEEPTQKILEAAAVAEDPRAPEGTLARRRGYEYIAIRGDEDKSNLLAVRTNTAASMTLVKWERRYEGNYRLKSGSNANAYSRLLVCDIELRHNVGFFGKHMVVAVVHLHNKVANHDKGFREQQKKFWPLLRAYIAQYQIDILMGDFNMSLFKVVPELRNGGVKVEMIAWYPWKATGGQAMADSCGMFLLNKPCEVTLCAGLPMLHEKGEDGIAWNGKAGYHGVSVTPGGFDVYDAVAGPGQALDTYLPKAADRIGKIEPSLTHMELPAPTPNAAVAVAAAEQKDSTGTEELRRTRPFLKIREKRLEAKLWKYQGEHYKGSHFPICAFTHNVGRRSEGRLAERQERYDQVKREAKKKGGEASQWRPRQQERGGNAWFDRGWHYDAWRAWGGDRDGWDWQ